MSAGGRPAMTPGELGIMRQDEGDGLHWSSGRCWCEEFHQGPALVPAAALTVVAPPWDRSRNPGAVRL